MSVLQCDRSGCESIMCKRHSDYYGFICDECFRKLCDTHNGSVAQFMGTPKNREHESHREAWRQSMEAIFPKR